MIRLGSLCTDTATDLKGMVTHYRVEMNGNRYYLFQPRGLNRETGEPVKRFWLVESRLKGGKVVPEPKLPIHVLGTTVEDAASGFTGTAVAIDLHISGCIHIDVQPRGTMARSGEHVAQIDFDIRRLKGKAITTLSESERERSQLETPSPSPSPRSTPRMPS